MEGQALGELAGQQRVGGRVDLGQGAPDQGDGPVGGAGVGGRLARPGQQLRLVHPGLGGGLAAALPQLEGPLELALGLGEGVGALGGQAGPDRRREGPLQVVGGVPVPGELGGQPRVVAVPGRQGGREPGVQAGPLPRQQLGVDRLLDQGVPEPVGAVAGVGQQHVGRDGLAQPGQQLGLGQAGHLGQEWVGHGRPGHGRDLQHLLGRLGQQLDPGQQGVAQAGRQLALGTAGGGGQLLDEEGVAAGAGVDPPGQLGRDRRPLDAGQLGRHLGRAEAGQLQALDPAAAVQLGQERPQRVAAVQLVGAVGSDQQEAAVAQVADQEGEQVAGGPVGPVQVLDHQHGPALGAQALQHPEQQLEQPPLLRPGAGGCGQPVEGRLAIGYAPPPGGRAPDRVGAPWVGAPGGSRWAQLGQEAGQLGPGLAGDQPGQGGLVQVAHQRPQGLDQGGEGHPLAAQLDTATGQHGGAGGPGPGHQLADQPGLADPGLAADQHRRRGAGGGPVGRRGQPGQLLGPADEGRAGERRRHVDEYGAALGNERAGGFAGSSLSVVGGHAHGCSS